MSAFTHTHTKSREEKSENPSTASLGPTPSRGLKELRQEPLSILAEQTVLLMNSADIDGTEIQSMSESLLAEN